MSADDVDTVPRSAKWLVGILFAGLLIPGIIGFDLWPLTGWRLFSLSRDDTQTRWVMDAVASDGTTRRVSLEDLPLAYRNAEWQMAELPDASDRQREAVCRDLRAAVDKAVPGPVELRISRDEQRMVERDGEWTVLHDPEVFQTC